jgi:hypothetical protein
MRCVLLKMGGQVGLNEGLLVTDGRVDILKLWLRLYPGRGHARRPTEAKRCMPKQEGGRKEGKSNKVRQILGV